MYIYISLFFLVFLIVFLLLANLGQIIARHNASSQQEIVLRTQEILDRLRAEGTNGTPQSAAPIFETDADAAPGWEKDGTASVSLLGDDPLFELLENHLAMMKRPGRRITATGKVGGLIVIGDARLDDATLNWLFEQNDAGANLLFLSLPQEALEQEEIRARLGIESVGEMTTYPGMRTSKEMMLGEILENDGSEEEGPMSVTALDVKPAWQVKVFAHALPEGHEEQDVADLPPLLWRYAPGGGKGYVYVCNGDFLSDETAYALLPTVLGDIHGSFIYPIVNAYCTMVDGFPYAQNEERALWRALYSRDGYGVQREILLPEWQRVENMYGTALTFFSPAYEEILADADAEMRFYHDELKQGNMELAGRRGEQVYLYESGEPLRVLPMARDFSFESDGNINIPYLSGEWLSPMQTLFRAAGMARGLGFIGLRIDVAELLEMENSMDMPEFFERLETLLGFQQTLYPWMERTTAQEAVVRIDAYANLRPAYAYREFGVTVTLEDFSGEAWFLLRTYGQNPQIDNGTIKGIGENLYLVEITEKSAEITWSGEEA